jgi:hypothetical protein
MIRKLLLVAFVLSVTSNSLAAVLPYLVGDGGCEANCCRVVRHVESQTSLSRLRCLMQCEHPAEHQGVPELPLLRSDRDSKVAAHIATAAVQAACLTRDARSARSTTRIEFAPTDIYLRTGTLLI